MFGNHSASQIQVGLFALSSIAEITIFFLLHQKSLEKSIIYEYANLGFYFGVNVDMVMAMW